MVGATVVVVDVDGFVEVEVDVKAIDVDEPAVTTDDVGAPASSPDSSTGVDAGDVGIVDSTRSVALPLGPDEHPTSPTAAAIRIRHPDLACRILLTPRVSAPTGRRWDTPGPVLDVRNDSPLGPIE